MGISSMSLFRNSACVGERVATAPGIARKHPDQLVASTSLAKRRLQLNKRSTVLPLRSCSSRAPCTRAMNSETDSELSRYGYTASDVEAALDEVERGHSARGGVKSFPDDVPDIDG